MTVICDEDKNGVTKQLISGSKVDVNSELISKYLPKQIDLEMFLENLKHKVIHDYEIPITIKELRAEYYSSPWFQDIYKYLKKGVCRYTGNAKFMFKQSCGDYFLINDVLFKIEYGSNLDKMTSVLFIPERYVPIILLQYHKDVLGGHPECKKID